MSLILRRKIKGKPEETDLYINNGSAAMRLRILQGDREGDVRVEIAAPRSYEVKRADTLSFGERRELDRRIRYHITLEAEQR
jgi:hypothetical protein